MATPFLTRPTHAKRSTTQICKMREGLRTSNDAFVPLVKLSDMTHNSRLQFGNAPLL